MIKPLSDATEFLIILFPSGLCWKVDSEARFSGGPANICTASGICRDGRLDGHDELLCWCDDAGLALMRYQGPFAIKTKVKVVVFILRDRVVLIFRDRVVLILRGRVVLIFRDGVVRINRATIPYELICYTVLGEMKASWYIYAPRMNIERSLS